MSWFSKNKTYLWSSDSVSVDEKGSHVQKDAGRYLACVYRVFWSQKFINKNPTYANYLWNNDHTKKTLQCSTLTFQKQFHENI